MFGFNIGTRFDAVVNPGGKNPRAGRQLTKESFPVLIMIGFARDDVRPRLLGGRIREPSLKFTQTTRWTIEQKRGVFEETLRTVFLPGTPGRPQLVPSDGYRLLNRVNETRATCKPVLAVAGQMAEFKDAVASFDNLFKANYLAYTHLCFGSFSSVSLPVDYILEGRLAEKAGPAPQDSHPSRKSILISEVRPGA